MVQPKFITKWSEMVIFNLKCFVQVKKKIEAEAKTQPDEFALTYRDVEKNEQNNTWNFESMSVTEYDGC